MSFTNCEICGRVIPAAESSTGAFLKTYCGCDIAVPVTFDADVLKQANYDARFKGRREQLLREYLDEQKAQSGPPSNKTGSIQPESGSPVRSDI